MNPKQVVQNYLDIFFGEKFNPIILKPLLTDDFSFNGPLMEANSSEEFIAKLKHFGEEIEMNATIHKLVCEATTVVAQYDFLLPNKSIVPATEWYEVEDGEISKMLLICDPKHFLI